MFVTQVFYQTRLQVATMATIYAPVTCVDYNTPSTDQTNGKANADLFIYVLYISDAN